MEYASPASARLITALAEVLDIRVSGPDDGAAHYLNGLDLRISRNMCSDDLVVEGAALRVVCTTAQPLARMRGEMAARGDDRFIITNLPPTPAPTQDPAITAKVYGRGRAMLVACPLASVELRRHW